MSVRQIVPDVVAQFRQDRHTETREFFHDSRRPTSQDNHHARQGDSSSPMRPCLIHPTFRSHVRAGLTGDFDAQPTRSRQPSNQRPDEHGSGHEPVNVTPCLRALLRTYRKAFLTCRGVRRI